MEKPGDEEEEDFDDGAGKAALVVELGGDLDEVAGPEVKVRVDFPALCSSCFQTFSLLALSSFHPLCCADHIQ